MACVLLCGYIVARDSKNAFYPPVSSAPHGTYQQRGNT